MCLSTYVSIYLSMDVSVSMLVAYDIHGLPAGRRAQDLRGRALAEALAPPPPPCCMIQYRVVDYLLSSIMTHYINCTAGH